MSGGQLKVPLTIRTQGGAGWTPGAQHAQQVEAWFVHVPGPQGRRIPRRPRTCAACSGASIYDDNPVVFFEHRLLYPLKGDVPDEIEPIPLGKARIMREGTDVTVVAIGRMVHEALAGGRRGREGGHLGRGRSTRGRCCRSTRRRSSARCKKTNRCVIAHEAVTRGGFGAEMAAVVQHGAFDYLDAPIERVGAKFAPLPFAPVMEEWVVPHAADVLDAIKRTVARS